MVEQLTKEEEKLNKMEKIECSRCHRMHLKHCAGTANVYWSNSPKEPIEHHSFSFCLLCKTRFDEFIGTCSDHKYKLDDNEYEIVSKKRDENGNIITK